MQAVLQWSNNSIKILFTALLVIVLLAIGFLYMVGYMLFGRSLCDDWYPGMTEAEKIFRLLDGNSQSTAAVFEFEEDGRIYQRLRKQVVDKSAVEILEEHPDCCHLVPQVELGAIKYKIGAPVPDGDEGIAYIRYPSKYVVPQQGVFSGTAVGWFNYNTCR
ncbi:MAG TPA: hypothetical protein VHP34_07690 [Alphaproteobacteria bacterium]|nr:hypothetical protein [Alphaproteobacteria bacterium]